MKYEGKKLNSHEVSIYTFSCGKEELEILLKIMEEYRRHTPKVFENIPYRGRLTGIVRTFAKVWVEEIKGKTLPTKHTGRFWKIVRKYIK